MSSCRGKSEQKSKAWSLTFGLLSLTLILTFLLVPLYYNTFFIVNTAFWVLGALAVLNFTTYSLYVIGTYNFKTPYADWYSKCLKDKNKDKAECRKSAIEIRDDLWGETRKCRRLIAFLSYVVALVIVASAIVSQFRQCDWAWSATSTFTRCATKA